MIVHVIVSHLTNNHNIFLAKSTIVARTSPFTPAHTRAALRNFLEVVITIVEAFFIRSAVFDALVKDFR